MLTVAKTETIVIRTETWETRRGTIAKAVVRDNKGRFNGVTNQTQNIALLNIVWV